MVIMSAKVSKRKLLTFVVAAAAIAVLLVVLLTGGNEPSAPPEEAGPSLDAGTNEERIAFLSSFGWTVDDAPVETQEVRVPQEFNDVFTRYNQLQQSQGFDLTELSGKTLRRYVYAINNYPGGMEDCYATVLVYKNRIVGGDVSCTSQGGTMHTFQMPS